MNQLTKKAIQEEISTDFNRFFRLVYQYLRVRVSADSEAEDLASDTMFQAWQKAEQYNFAFGEPAAWLIGIAKNQLKMFWRKNKIQTIDWEAVEPFLKDENFFDNLCDTLEVERILSNLNEEQRAIVIMRHLDGFSYEEISQLVNRQPAAVRQIVSRAMRFLQGAVKEKS